MTSTFIGCQIPELRAFSIFDCLRNIRNRRFKSV
jgi:hypothetical protein